MTQRDRPAVDIHFRRVELELAHAGDRLRGEGLVQLDEIDLVDLSPARLSTFWVAGMGPRPMQPGSTPAAAVATMRASGSVSTLPPLPPVTSSAAAPSLMPLELAAVTVPPCLNAGLSFATDPSVVPGRGYSSFAKLEPSARGTGTSSSVNTQSESARSARRWLSTPNASCSALPIL